MQLTIPKDIEQNILYFTQKEAISREELILTALQHYFKTKKRLENFRDMIGVCDENISDKMVLEMKAKRYE